MSRDISVTKFTAMALEELARSFSRPSSQGGTFGSGDATYTAARVNVGFRVSPAEHISTHPALAYAFNSPGVRFGDRTTASSRPISKDGATSFHFSHSFASKSSPIKHIIREYNGGRIHYKSGAANHLLYIEREGAAEELDGSENGPAKGDVITVWETAALDRTAVDQQEYLERLGAPERLPQPLNQNAEIERMEISSFGNIGATLEDRVDFWNAVEIIERDPRGDSILARFAVDNTAYKAAFSRIAAAPKSLAPLLLKAFSQSTGDVRFAGLSTAQAFDVYKWLSAHAQNVPIEIIPGRGGRVQNRIIAELPHEITAHQRLKIVKKFTDNLAKKNLPFWAVIHAPDRNNDKRNYHVHIVYYDRPATLTKSRNPLNNKNVWDFEVIETKRFANRHTRKVRPHMQEKDREASARGWIGTLRGYWEEASNDVLDEAGATKRYDRRPYKKMGINLDPLKHIPSKTFNKERKGDVTVVGVNLARRQWDVLLESVVNKNATRTHMRIEKIDARVKKIAQTLQTSSPYKLAAIEEVRRLSAVAKVHARAIGLAELMQDVARVLADRLASRAKLIFHGSVDAQTKKRRGRPSKTPTATAIFTPEAKEAARFLKTLIQGVREIDKTNAREVTIARGQFAIIARRLDHLGAAPHLDPEDRTHPSANRVDRMQQTPEQRAQRMEQMIQRMYTTVADLWAKSSLDPAKRQAEPQIRTDRGTDALRPIAPTSDNNIQATVAGIPRAANNRENEVLGHKSSTGPSHAGPRINATASPLSDKTIPFKNEPARVNLTHNSTGLRPTGENPPATSGAEQESLTNAYQLKAPSSTLSIPTTPDQADQGMPELQPPAPKKIIRRKARKRDDGFGL